MLETGENGDGITFDEHYQLQRKSTGQVSGIETLGRVWDDQHRLVSPAEFLPQLNRLSPELRLQHALMQIQHAIGALQLFREAMPPEKAEALRIAINLSPDLLTHHGLGIVHRFQDVLSRAGGSFSDVVIECTEDAHLENIHGPILRELDHRDAIVSLDDVGAPGGAHRLKGLLGLLGKYPFIEVKMDRSMLRESELSPRLKKMAATLVGRNKKVVIEGIERPGQQSDFCNYVTELGDGGANISWQGFHDNGRPTSADETVKKIESIAVAA